MEWNETEIKVRTGFSDLGVPEKAVATAVGHLGDWLADPARAVDRPQIEFLIETGAWGALFDAFSHPIPFGTGGRRGPVGFGPNRMNLHTVATSTQGHAEFLRQQDGGPDPAVVIAYDVREYQDLRGVYDPARPNPLRGVTSRDFARLAARVYAANGIKVWFPAPHDTRYLSTPELSFTIRQLRARGGLNLSASHNHPDDNGAKIYNAAGSQETPPLDQEIAAIIAATTSAHTLEWQEGIESGRIVPIPNDVHEAYLNANLAAGCNPNARGARIVFTPLHGTGVDSVAAVLERAGFEVRMPESQRAPDGAFPGAPFRSPNPEIPESLSAAIEMARAEQFDLVLGADPDADRLGMAAPDRDGRWSCLTGNDIGVLLTAYLLDRAGAGRRARRPFAAVTTVTSSLFRRIADAHGVQTLCDLPVGFKYIAEVMNGIETEGRFRTIEASIDDFVLAYEESFGYLVIAAVRDKDAAGAALLLAELASLLKKEGRTMLEELDAIHRRYGYVRNRLRATVMRGTGGLLQMRRIQESLRTDPPARIGAHAVVRCVDGWDESGPRGSIRSETDRASRDILAFELDGDARVVLRPSGTEPKNKIYVEACGRPAEKMNDAEWDAHRHAIDQVADRIGDAFAAEMLARIDLQVPPWALAVSDLVPLESKVDFGRSFLPELVEKIGSGGGDGDPERAEAVLNAWIDRRLAPYGPDGRLLVRSGVAAYLRDDSPPGAIATRLRTLFGLDD